MEKSYTGIASQGGIDLKKHVSLEELNQLSESQKDALRDLWKPEKNELLIVPMCKDVENDIYDYDIYVLQDIRVNQINNDKRYDFADDFVQSYDYCEIIIKAVPIQQTGQAYETEAGFFNDLEEINDSPFYEINKSDCLPWLDISKMVEILYEHKYRIEVLLDSDVQSCYVDEQEFEGDTLCDALWEAVKKML